MSYKHTLEDMRSSLLDHSATQIAAVYDNEQDVQESVNELTAVADVGQHQITVINPSDMDFSEKLEQDSQKLSSRMWYSHIISGAAGLAVGLIVAWVLVSVGPALTQNNPLFTFIAMISPGVFIGLFMAGLFNLRPDRTEIIDMVRHAIRRKHFAVVVNLKKSQQVSKVSSLLAKRSHKVTEALA
ncbi:DUF368 domain-containing protein [Salinimonas lutimaris]|uniref:DUF368 domain-containing protein n=1 Tax=Salinimonas lutimaris TaxID=914153 RepID=UPI0010BF73A3|nr:DUF368 domain-containing protein [Salinimonas lutimaris]